MNNKVQIRAFVTPNFCVVDSTALEDGTSLLDRDIPDRPKTDKGKIKKTGLS